MAADRVFPTRQRVNAREEKSVGLLMKPGAGSFYPCLIAGPLLRAINCSRLVRRRDESVQWRFTFCQILSHLIETEMNEAAYNGVG
jgi:hypothetical protein